MKSIFCPEARLARLQRKQQCLSAVLETINSTPADSPPESYLETFQGIYGDEPVPRVNSKRLGKTLKAIAENKRRTEFEKKIEKKQKRIGEQLSRTSSVSSSSSNAAGDSSGASSTTLVDSDDDEKKEGEVGEPLELTWTWSALGEAI